MVQSVADFGHEFELVKQKREVGELPEGLFRSLRPQLTQQRSLALRPGVDHFYWFYELSCTSKKLAHGLPAESVKCLIRSSIRPAPGCPWTSEVEVVKPFFTVKALAHYLLLVRVFIVRLFRRVGVARLCLFLELLFF